MEQNMYNIPADRWNRLGSDNQETFNQVYGKCIKKKDGLLTTIPADQREAFAPLLDKVIIEVVETAVESLHHA